MTSPVQSTEKLLRLTLAISRVGGAAGLAGRTPVEVDPHVLPGEGGASVGGRHGCARQGGRAGIVLAQDPGVGITAPDRQEGPRFELLENQSPRSKQHAWAKTRPPGVRLLLAHSGCISVQSKTAFLQSPHDLISNELTLGGHKVSLTAANQVKSIARCSSKALTTARIAAP